MSKVLFLLFYWGKRKGKGGWVDGWLCVCVCLVPFCIALDCGVVVRVSE